MTKIFHHILALIVGFCLVVMAIPQIFFPGAAHAKPLPGFTPTPTTPDEGDEGGDTTDNGDDDSDPTDFVIVQIEQCSLSYSAQETSSGSATAALTSVGGEASPLPLLIPTEPELLAQVQLIHQGSGFIVEGTLSNQQSTRFSVPYPGQWQVLLMATPQVTAGDQANFTLLESNRDAPELLGLVEANVLTPQLVKCPLNCVVEPPSTALETLPTTGADHETMLLTIAVLLFAGVNLLIVGIVFWLPPSSPPET